MNIFKGKIVTVTGAAGSIGSEICRKLAQCGVHRLKCFDNSEYGLYRLSQELKSNENVRYLLGDVRDSNRLQRAIFDSDFVIHAAALKHVKFCEFNPDEAFKTNVVGTQNIVDSCRKANVEHCILISTDKAVKPTSVMGTTKSLAEKIFMNAPERSITNKTKFTAVRFGNVFGSAGSVIETFHGQINNNEKITLTDENISRYFMSISDACDLVLQCFERSSGDKIFILKMKKAKIIDIAKSMNSILNPGSTLSFKITGLLPGEKFDEILLDDVESRNCVETESFYIISKDKSDKKINLKDTYMSGEELNTLIKDWLRSRR